MKSLETPRLLLRPFAMGDLEDFFEYARNPNVGPSAGWSPHKSLAESRDVLRGFIRADEVWAIVLRETGKVIGSIGLHPDRLRGAGRIRMLGYVLSEPYWGMGYATEAARRVVRFAFEEFGLGLLSIYHFSFNSRSKRVIEKCGFLLDGVFRYATDLPDGNITDDVCYSMTREDYRRLYEAP